MSQPVASGPGPRRERLQQARGTRGAREAQPRGLERQRPSPGTAGDVAVGHQHECRRPVLDEPLQAQPGGGRQQAALAVGPGQVERHHVEEPRARERRHRSRGVGECFRLRLFPAAARAAQPEQPLEVDARGFGRDGIEPVERVHERREGARARRARQKREQNAGAARGGGAVDLALLAAREAAGEEPVDLRDAGRERPSAPVLAAQRRRVGLQPASPQQVFESALALRDARGVAASQGARGRVRAPPITGGTYAVAGRVAALISRVSSFAFSSLS